MVCAIVSPLVVLTFFMVDIIFFHLVFFSNQNQDITLAPLSIRGHVGKVSYSSKNLKCNHQFYASFDFSVSLNILVHNVE